MAYRANVSNKQQADIERAEDDSAIRIHLDSGTKSIKANDMSAQAPSSNGTPSAMRQISGSGAVVGSHDDRPYRFATPGKS